MYLLSQCASNLNKKQIIFINCRNDDNGAHFRPFGGDLDIRVAPLGRLRGLLDFLGAACAINFYFSSFDILAMINDLLILTVASRAFLETIDEIR